MLTKQGIYPCTVTSHPVPPIRWNVLILCIAIVICKMVLHSGRIAEVFS